jgi:hypothetical protein
MMTPNTRDLPRQALIGVRRDLAVAKQDLLLFDHVVVLGLTRQLERAARTQPTLAADASYLHEQGVLREGPDVMAEFALGVVESTKRGDTVTVPYLGIGTSASGLLSPKIEEAFPYARGDLGLSNPDMMQILRMVYCASGSSFRPSSELLASLIGTQPAQTASLYESREEATGAYATILSQAFPHSELPAAAAPPDGQSLVEIVVDNLPIPGEDVPLDYILDFVRDSTTAAKLRRLQRVLEMASLDQVAPERFILELEGWFADYAEYVRIAEMRHRPAVLTLFLSFAGAIEELVHLRPRKSIDALLEFKKLKADDRDAELKAPGRETAFIYEARRNFGL